MKDKRKIEFDNVHLCLNENEIMDNKTNAFLYNIYQKDNEIIFLNKSLARPDKFTTDSQSIVQSEISIAYSIGNSPVFGIVPMKVYNILLVLLTDDSSISITINAAEFDKILPFVQSKNISDHPIVDKYSLLEILARQDYMDEFRRICDAL